MAPKLESICCFLLAVLSLLLIVATAATRDDDIAAGGNKGMYEVVVRSTRNDGFAAATSKWDILATYLKGFGSLVVEEKGVGRCIASGGFCARYTERCCAGHYCIHRGLGGVCS